MIWCGGFKSDMEGSKALVLEEACRAQNVEYIRFDYFGHGKSDGAFAEGTITRWKEDVLEVIDKLTDRPVILVGSSMGGWLMLLAALARPERVIGLLGIASAPGFTETLLWNQMTAAQQAQLQKEGMVLRESDYDEPYAISMQLIEDGRTQQLLDRDVLPIRCPIRLLHGCADVDVPYQFSEHILQKVMSQDVQLQLIKAGDHRLSNDIGLHAITRTLTELLTVTC